MKVRVAVFLGLSFGLAVSVLGCAQPSPARESQEQDAASVDAATGLDAFSPMEGTVDGSVEAAAVVGADAVVGDGDAACHRGPDLALIAHSCLHAAKGPFITLEASLGAGPHPSVDAPHTAYRVSLPRAGDGFSGRLSFRSRAAGYVAFFASEVIALAVIDSKGHPLPIPPQDNVSRWCPELPEVATLWLEPGTHEVALTGVVGTVTLVLEAASELICVYDRVPLVSLDAGVPMCRSSGPCTRHEECCEFCHDFDHCH